GVLVVPVYEEQLVVVKRLCLREHVRGRRVATTDKRLFEDTLRRARLPVEDPSRTRLVRERFPAEGAFAATEGADVERRDSPAHNESGGLLETIKRAFQPPAER